MNHLKHNHCILDIGSGAICYASLKGSPAQWMARNEKGHFLVDIVGFLVCGDENPPGPPDAAACVWELIDDHVALELHTLSSGPSHLDLLHPVMKNMVLAAQAQAKCADNSCSRISHGSTAMGATDRAAWNFEPVVRGSEPRGPSLQHGTLRDTAPVGEGTT